MSHCYDSLSSQFINSNSSISIYIYFPTTPKLRTSKSNIYPSNMETPSIVASACFWRMWNKQMLRSPSAHNAQFLNKYIRFHENRFFTNNYYKQPKCTLFLGIRIFRLVLDGVANGRTWMNGFASKPEDKQSTLSR